MLPAVPNPLVRRWFDWYARQSLRKSFFRLHLYAAGTSFDEPRSSPSPTLYVANHTSFWDGIVLNYLLRTRAPWQALYCMIDERQVREHPFFRRVGGFGVDREHPRDAIRSIRYAADLLAGGAAVVVFPQGRIEPADARPIRVEGGAARVLALAPPATRVVPVGLRYEFWTEQRAEAMVRWGDALDLHGRPRREASEIVAATLTSYADELRAFGLAHRPGNRILLHGKRSISRWKDRLRRTPVQQDDRVPSAPVGTGTIASPVPRVW